MSTMLRTRGSSSRSAAPQVEHISVPSPPMSNKKKKLQRASGSRIASVLNFGFALLVLAVGGWRAVSFLFSLSEKTKSNAAEGAPPRRQLRFDWSNMPVTSDMAKQILEHQSDCSLPLTLGNMQGFGLGSDIHGWGKQFCANLARGKNRQFFTTEHPWIWRDEDACNPNDISLLQCYFPGAEALCPNDPNRPTGPKKSRKQYEGGCAEVMGGTTQENISAFRAATTEFLFHNVSNVVINEAERQLKLVFPDGVVPPKLITVHIRWGDKTNEMQAQSIDRYIDAVNTILALRQDDDSSNANIFLATEDPEAVKAFMEATPSEWNVYLDQFFHDMISYRDNDQQKKPANWAVQTKGRAGLVALGSLLLSMEADDYVLTTGSNWSRLMNELRKNVLDPRCNGCTHMVDLMPGEL